MGKLEKPLPSQIAESANQTAIHPSSLEPRTKIRVNDAYGRLPLYFMENQGQVDRRVRYYTRGGRHAIRFTSEGIYFTFLKGRDQAVTTTAGPGAKGKLSPSELTMSGNKQTVPPTVVRLTPLGMRPEVELVALEPQEGKVNYFLGKDPRKWHTHIPTYRAVVYREAYPGIDLKFYGSGRQMAYDIILQAGADPGQVRFQYSGIQGLEVTKEGDLTIRLPDGGTLVQKKPVIYQEIAGGRVAREGKFRIHRDEARPSYGFEVAAYDQNYPLIIDPTLVYSTYLGGNNSDQGRGIAVDSAGNVYVTGMTNSTDFPTQDPLYAEGAGGDDVFVTKINAAGTALVYSTYLGGSKGDAAYAIAVDSAGNAYVTGGTASDDFPTRNALYPEFKAKIESAFVIKINPQGSDLVYSTYLGGSVQDDGWGIAADGAGNAYVAGSTSSSDFPTSQHPLYSFKGVSDAFVTKINAAGTALIYSTFLGGLEHDGASGIAADSEGNAYVTGITFSTDFPTTENSLYPFKGVCDAFVTKINAAGTALVYSTLLGGSDQDWGGSVAVDRGGNAYVTGGTFSDNFPTANALYPSGSGSGDAFVTKINALGNALIYSTYLGGAKQDQGYGIAVDQSGNAYVSGYTMSTDFPAKNAPFPNLRGVTDAFVTKIFSDGLALAFSTYLGGGGLGTECGYALAVDKAGNAYVTGVTLSNDFPTKNPLFPISGNMLDTLNAFVTKIGVQDITPIIMDLLLAD
jgi:hypothetical protein